MKEICATKKQDEWGDLLLPLTKGAPAKLVLETTRRYNATHKVFELSIGNYGGKGVDGLLRGIEDADKSLAEITKARHQNAAYALLQAMFRNYNKPPWTPAHKPKQVTDALADI